MNVELTVDLDNSADLSAPSLDAFQRWIAAALQDHRSEAEVSIRIVGCAESQALNLQYRGKDKPTNVLSFPTDFPSGLEIPLLGDLVICQPLVEQEAAEQRKLVSAHWAHLTIHGTLHLLGYDHIDDAEADIMESLETKILTTMGYPPPYEPSNGDEDSL
ncbi:rRNA maturation RNase YbeY [Umboniibacter marinipuniceus]|nr:rRNA maturation RNase YbeY [Umboniibacter marinipuniceus]